MVSLPCFSVVHAVCLLVFFILFILCMCLIIHFFLFIIDNLAAALDDDNEGVRLLFVEDDANPSA